MATFTVSGVDIVVTGMQTMVQKVPQIRNAMLRAGAKVVQEGLKESISTNLNRRSGNLEDSIKIGRITVACDVSKIRIGPTGEHHRYFPITGSGVATSGQVLYVHEYGSRLRGIPAAHVVSKAVAKYQDAAVEAELQVFDEMIEKLF